MKRFHKLGEIIEAEVISSRTSVETNLQAEVNRVSTILDGRLRTIPISGRGKQLKRSSAAGRMTGCHLCLLSCKKQRPLFEKVTFDLIFVYQLP
jgi:hypothetical protein